MSREKPIATDHAADLARHEMIRQLLDSPASTLSLDILEAFKSYGTEEYIPPGLFRQAVEQAPVATSITDPAANILYVNRAFETLTGYRRDEVVGHNESMLSSKSTPLSVYQELWKTIQSSRVWHGTLVNHKKGSEEYLADLVISPVLNKEGEIAYYLGMHHDVTEVHQLEQRLKFQKSLIEGALDAAPMVVAMLARDGRVLLDNNAYKALLGDFRGREPASLLLEALKQQIGFDLATGCSEGRGFTNVELRLDSVGGAPRWFSCSGVYVPELDGKAENYFRQDEKGHCNLLLVANDITANRERINEARLNMIRTSMVEQQMVQTMREAISGAIYKLQAPLNVIKAALAMPAAGAQQSGLRTVLQQALESGDEAMDSLYAALPSPSQEKATKVNLNEILHEVLRLSTGRLLAAGVVVDWRPAMLLPAVTGRPNALRGLFKYLLDNAIQALNESGRDFREVRVETSVDDQELVVEVTDNGIGVVDAFRLKIFEPFFCGWSQSGGHAGMGLTMAQEIVLEHGGSMQIDPEFIGGCRVNVRLPMTGAGGE